MVSLFQTHNSITDNSEVVTVMDTSSSPVRKKEWVETSSIFTQNVYKFDQMVVNLTNILRMNFYSKSTCKRRSKINVEKPDDLRKPINGLK